VVLVHYLLVTEKHGASRMMLGAGGRGRRSVINALPYARLPPAINPAAFAPYAAALPAAPAALGPVSDARATHSAPSIHFMRAHVPVSHGVAYHAALARSVPCHLFRWVARRCEGHGCAYPTMCVCPRRRGPLGGGALTLRPASPYFEYVHPCNV
jgi:hypothetical protein